MPNNAATAAARLSIAPMMDGTGSLKFPFYCQCFAEAAVGDVVKNVVTNSSPFSGARELSKMRNPAQ